jgi:hypothetical protein
MQDLAIQTWQNVTMFKPFGEAVTIEIVSSEEQTVMEPNQLAKEPDEMTDDSIEDANIQLPGDVSSTCTIHGISVHKSHAVNSLLNCKTKFSTDRLRRVCNQMVDKSASFSDSKDDNSIFLTDTILVPAKLKDKRFVMLLCSITRIEKSGCVESCVDINEISSCKFCASILVVTSHENKLIWSGDYGGTLSIDGKFCFNFPGQSNDQQMEYQMDEIIRIEMLFREILADNTHLIPTVANPYNADVLSLLLINLRSIAISNDSKTKCRICSKQVKLALMRSHIGKHIIDGTVKRHEHLCGFCGIVGCKISIVKTSGYGTSANYGPDSDCKYKIRFSLGAVAKGSKSAPCTNRPVKCAICQNIYWSYNLEQHFENSHPGSDFEKISDAEKYALLNF